MIFYLLFYNQKFQSKNNNYATNLCSKKQKCYALKKVILLTATLVLNYVSQKHTVAAKKTRFFIILIKINRNLTSFKTNNRMRFYLEF